MVRRMSTVSECMEHHRLALREGHSPKPGPAVLVEAMANEEVLLPEHEEKKPARIRWSTMKVQMTDEDLKQHHEARIERMLALQPLIGNDSPVHLIEKHSDTHATHVCLGRAKRNDILIVDDTVSSLHAQLQDDDQQVWLCDMNSSNGTFVNRRRLVNNERVFLVNGDCVRFGRRVFYFLTGERWLLFLELRIVQQYGRHAGPTSSPSGAK